MYCPTCKTVTSCAGKSPSLVGLPSGQRWHRTDHPDIQWFRRLRLCNVCGEAFITAEINEGFLTELVELRSALAAVKEHAESYIRESKAAAKSLDKLTASLKVLRALRVYQEQPE